MVGLERELGGRNLADQPIELGAVENVSIAEEILRRRGLEFIEQVPFEVGRELIAVDSVQADLSSKVKLLGYRFWYQDKRFDLIKDYLPEGMFRLDNLDEVMTNQNGLGNLYDRVSEVADIADEIMPEDIRDINRYRAVFVEVQRLFAVFPSEEFVIAQTERIQRNTSNQNGERKIEEPVVIAIEWLKNKGFYQKEISGILKIPERRIEFILRGLYFQGRCEPQPEQADRTRKFIELALEVEKLRKRKLTIRQIAERLQVDKRRVQDAARVLISIGRIDPIGPAESLERRYRTKQNKARIRKALRSFMHKNPGEQISFSVLRDLSGVSVDLETISSWYHEIAASEEVPPVKDDARERAVEFLLELGRTNRKVINLRELSGQSKIAYKTLLRAYDEIRHDPDAPILKLADYERKKREFIDALRGFLITNPDGYFNIKNFCRGIGLNYTTGIRWYWKLASSEQLPPINSRWKKSKAIT